MGSEYIDWKKFLMDVKSADYSGIKCFPFSEVTEGNEFTSLFKKYDLKYSVVMIVTSENSIFEKYLSQLKNLLTKLLT